MYSWCTGIRYEESLKAFVEHYARDVVYLSAKMQKNPWAQKAGLHILQRDIVNVVQVLTLAGGDTFRSCATIFETLLWEMMPLLKERVGSVALQGTMGINFEPHPVMCWFVLPVIACNFTIDQTK